MGGASWCQAVCFIESQVPRPGADELTAGVWWVGLDTAGAEEDVDPFGAQGADAVAERRAAGQG